MRRNPEEGERGELNLSAGSLTSPGAVSVTNDIRFEVKSLTKTATYAVTFGSGGWRCSCPAWVEADGACKHIDRVLLKLDPRFQLNAINEDRPVRRGSYSQNWPAYDAAQQAEHAMFDALLWDLLEQIPERRHPFRKIGRPEIPLRIQFLVTVKKIHLNESSRRARGLMQTQVAGGSGPKVHIPSYAVPHRLLIHPETTSQLVHLIQLSSLPLAGLEDGGTVAIDSSGFCTSCRGAYCTEKHDPNRKHRWVKAHIAVGTRTHSVLAVRVTDEHGADCPQFVPLLKDVVESGFSPDRVVADKAYLSRENLETAQGLGIDPYIPYKSNSVQKRRSSPIWRRKYFEFQARREEFAALYHARSNVEATFSAIKRKLGEELYSHRPIARLNELLAKLLAYNIGVLIHEIFENGIDPGVPGISLPNKPTAPAPEGEAS